MSQEQLRASAERLFAWAQKHCADENLNVPQRQAIADTYHVAQAWLAEHETKLLAMKLALKPDAELIDFWRKVAADKYYPDDGKSHASQGALKAIFREMDRRDAAIVALIAAARSALPYLTNQAPANALCEAIVAGEKATK